MIGNELEERKQTLADTLKARAINVSQGLLSEICIILVDTSSSMNESINKNAGRSKIEAVRLAIPNLQARGVKVMYGLVGFGSHASTYQQLTMLFGLILLQGEMLHPEGMTNITAGLREGLEMMVGKIAEKKRMIMLSDGYANEETHLIDHKLALCREGGVIVDTIAFGDSADRERLKDIANKTGGVFYEAGSEQQLKDAYAKLNYSVRYLEYKKE